MQFACLADQAEICGLQIINYADDTPVKDISTQRVLKLGTTTYQIQYHYAQLE